MVYELVRQWWQEVRALNYAALGSAAVLLLVVMFGLWSVRGWYVSSREESAQLALSEAFNEYDEALAMMMSDKNSQDVIRQRLEDAHLSFDVMFRNHGSSYLVPYARAFEADVYWHEGKKDEAIASLEQAVRGAAKSPAFYLLKTKLALMKLDAGQEEQALSELQVLAQDKHNPNADAAAFNLGYYYWTMQDEAKARQAWQLLEQFTATNGLQRSASPYLALAQMKLGLIS